MTPQAQASAIRLELLGGFKAVVAGEVVEAGAWSGRRAVELVQLLAIAEGRRLTRDEVLEALWPRLDADAGAANLRKAAHHARRALANPDGVVLRGGQVSLLPSGSVETDVERFESQARKALAGDDPAACAEVAASYPGELLPEALYEDWTQAPRERLRSLHVELLRRSGEWELLVEADPTDEPAYLELMRRELAGEADRPRSAGTAGCGARCDGSSGFCPALRSGLSTTSASPDSGATILSSSAAKSSLHRSPRCCDRTIARAGMHWSCGARPESASRRSAGR